VICQSNCARKACSLALLALLAGCAPTRSACPPLKEYDPGFVERLAGELETLPAAGYPATYEAIADYRLLRALVRECQ